MTVVETLTRQRTLPATLPEPFHTIAGNCLKEKPGERWTPDEILRHLGGACSHACGHPSPAHADSQSERGRAPALSAVGGFVFDGRPGGGVRMAVVQNAIERREHTNRRRGG